MRFLVDRQILRAVKRLARHDGELLVAVAFWGRGAARQTGITERALQSAQPTRILCDLLSGACNPAEIRCLQESGVEVKYRPQLHAKVWISGNEVVVGSANASTNGLGFEAAGSNIEAAVHLCDDEVAENVQQWFSREWEWAECIDDALLQTAETLWRKRKITGGMIMKCVITAYEAGKSSKEGRNRFDEIAPNYFSQDELTRICERAEE